MQAISFKNVSKVYKKGPKISPNLRDWFYFFGHGQFQIKQNAFYALRNIDLDIQSGEIVGIIGRNGAGKSTLLKLISRVTYPTSGEIVTRGRPAGLLELRAGFHPELTGKENIFFKSAILGISRREIKKKLKKIIAFSELRSFIDTPIKYYSSGMYARLGFSVAIHAKSDILLIDEVLSVGDASFEKKCLAKIHDFCHNRSKTVIFVSHNFAYVKRICEKVFWLDNGKIVKSGRPSRIIKEYLKEQG